MKKCDTPKVDPIVVFKQLGLDIDNVLNNITDSSSQQIVTELYSYLQQASQVEHLLAMQYLFAAFSMKKAPEEFDDYGSGNPAIDAKRVEQLEYIRRWEAEILFVSRQEMEHLNLVQNLIIVLGQQPYLFRPNFPVPDSQNILQQPINLIPFSESAIEIFRYWEKPDSVVLPDPYLNEGIPKGIRNFGKSIPHPTTAQKHDPDAVRKAAFSRIESIVNGTLGQAIQFTSIEQLYETIWLYFAVLFELRLIDGQNLMKVSEEHFGFNISLDAIVDGKYFDYVDKVIAQIIEEGEGASIDDPDLLKICDGDLMGSHFCVYSQLLKEIQEQQANSAPAPFAPALPVVWNPTISSEIAHHRAPLADGLFDPTLHPVTPVTNPVGIAAMQLFNTGYDVLVRMLNGYFTDYSIDYTTGIRPQDVNAFFRTAFYPFMTMVIRPLGELVCRLPANADYVPVPGKVPPATAGPNFFYNIPQNDNREAELEATAVFEDPQAFITIFNQMAVDARALATMCTTNNYHVANYKTIDVRDFDVRFNYLAENLDRIALNFKAYWDGFMIAPIPSKGFQNFNNSFN